MSAGERIYVVDENKECLRKDGPLKLPIIFSFYIFARGGYITPKSFRYGMTFLFARLMTTITINILHDTQLYITHVNIKTHT